jgi:hypothetical protein
VNGHPLNKTIWTTLESWKTKNGQVLLNYCDGETTQHLVGHVGHQRNSILHNKDHPWVQLESDAENWQIDKEYNQSPLNLDSGNQWL